MSVHGFFKLMIHIVPIQKDGFRDDKFVFVGLTLEGHWPLTKVIRKPPKNDLIFGPIGTFFIFIVIWKVTHWTLLGCCVVIGLAFKEQELS